MAKRRRKKNPSLGWWIVGGLAFVAIFGMPSLMLGVGSSDNGP